MALMVVKLKLEKTYSWVYWKQYFWLKSCLFSSCLVDIFSSKNSQKMFKYRKNFKNIKNKGISSEKTFLKSYVAKNNQSKNI
jgi:hypothetical protein